MVKSFKKAIAVLISVLMIATSLPFTALTASAAENAGLNTAISAYESKMNGTIYNNMKAAYDAYVTACYAKEALSVGDTTTYNIANVTSALNSATNAMTAWSAYTGNAKGSFDKDNDKVSDSDYNDVYKNLLYVKKGISTNDRAQSSTDVLVTSDTGFRANGFFYYGETTMLYDGKTAPQFGIAYSMTGTKKPTTWNYNQLRAFTVGFSANQDKLVLPEAWHGTDSQLNFQWNYLAHSAGDTYVYDQTSHYTNGMNGKFLTNVIRYDDSTGFDSIIKEINPTFLERGGWDKKNGTRTTTPANKTIRIFNYKKVLDELSNRKSTLANVSSFKQGGLATVLEGIELATKDPNSFFTNGNYYGDCRVNYENALTKMATATAADTYKTITGKKGSDVLGTFTLSTGCKASTVKAALDSVLTETQGRDADYHYDYSWPATTDVTADATYNVVTKAGDHDQNGDVVSETLATCETDGQKVVECSICRQEQTITLTKTGHAYGDSTKDWDAYVDDDTTYTHTKVCANDDSHKVTANCSFSAWTDDGEGNQTRTCSVCGGVQSRVAEVGKVSYTFQLPNGTVVENKEVDADTVVDAPSLDAYAFNDTEGHHTFTWENAQYTITDDTTITAIEDVANHNKATKNVNFVNVDEDTLLATSCNENRTYSYDVLTYCTECDVTFGSVTNNVDPLAHTSTKYALNTDDTTTHNISCEVCHKVTSTQGHNFTTNTVNPTCTAQGYTTYTCEDCEYSYNADFTELAAHSYGDYISLGDGTHKRVCEECLYEDINSCEMTGSIVNPTCTEAGYYTMKCTLCDYDTGKQDLVIEASEYCDTAYPSQYGQNSYSASYKFVDKNGVIKPTKMVVTVKHRLYNTDGFAGIGASRGSITVTGGDGVSQSYTTSGTNTNPTDRFITLETNSDSFTITGSKITGNGANDSCGIEITNIKVYADIPALGHDYSVEVPSSAVAATCTEDGKNADIKCSRCEDVKTGSTIGKLGHSFTNYVSNNDATCTEDGTKTAKCDRCDATDTIDDTDSKLGHDYSVDLENGYAATCTTDGKNTDMQCSRCDDVQIGTTINMLGHDYASVVTNPTCTEQGYTTYTCTRCPASYVSDYTDPTGHTCTIEVENTAAAPTCTEDGKEADMKCVNCDYVETGATIGKLGHSFTNYVSNNDATCTEDGTKTAKCDRCDATDTIADTDSKLGHDYSVDLENGYAATCTEDGKNTDMQCSRCDAVQTGTTIDKLGHSFTNYVENNDAITATCVTEGKTASKTATCDREGCEVTDTIEGTSTGLDADNHENVVTDEAVDPTEESAGLTEGSHCTACDTVIDAQQEVPALGYTITFNGKTKVTHNFPVGTPAADVYEWAVANVESKAPTSSSHYYWKEASFVDVTAAKSYSMTSYNHYNDLVITYEGDEATGVKINRTCETCGYTDQLDAVAKVGDKYFSAIKAATDACTSADDVVTIITDVTTAVANAITNSCTIDLNGKTITMTGSGAVFNITFNSSDDPTAPTKVTFIDSVGTSNVVATNGTSGMGISVGKPNVDVQINGGNYQTVTESVYVYPQYKKSLKYYDITGAIITVNGGTFASSASSKLTLNLNDNAREGNGYIVNGGTYSKFNPLGNVEITVPADKVVDDTIADVYTVFDGDFTAYNAVLTEANMLNESTYTAQSWAALQSALGEGATLVTSQLQSNINAATAMIQTAIDELEAVSGLTVIVNVEVDGEVAGTQTYTAEYGDTVSIDVTDTLNGASIQKWTIEQENATSKLSMANPVYDMVVTANATVTIIATANKTEEDPSYTKVKFTDRGYKTIGYGYVMSTTEIETANVCPIEGSGIVAPEVAFYNFVGWEEIARNVFVATYTVAAIDLYEVEAGSENIKVNDLDKDYIDYDENIVITYTGDKMLGMQVDGKIIPITDINNVHAPYGANDVNVKIIEIEESSLVPTSMITGKFTRPGDAGKTIAAFNAMYYLPEGCTLVECGVYAKKNATFDESTLNTATKVRSQSQSKNNEYTISMQSNYAASGVTKVYGMSYVTYKTTDGTIETAYSDVAVINV